MRIKATALALFLASACSTSRAEEPARSSPAEEIRRMVAAQGTAELNAWRASHPGFSPQQISLLRTEEIEGGAMVWYAVLPLDHFPPYTVLQKGNDLVRLGGFSNPELERAADLLGLRATDSATTQAASRRLALLADRNGAEEYVLPGSPSPSDSTVVRAWRSRSIFAWRPDTVFRRPDGGWVGRLTVLSRQARSYGQDWRPAAYTFVFSADGQLSSWSARTADTFQVPAPTN